MIWTKFKNAAIRTGLDPWLRPIAEKLRGPQLEDDDVATLELISRLARNAVCVDVGCHKGKFLDPMRRAASDGRFFAFEPVPYLNGLLKSKYRADSRVQVFNIALSSTNGNARFFIDEQNMGLSGLSERPRHISQDRLMRVDVAVRTLDGVLGSQHVDFIKIDVEGAEFDVLQGARQTIARSRPVILFEFGLGGADYFGIDADKMYEFISSLDYALFTVDDFASGRETLSLSAFRSCFELNSKYNFVASPRN